MGNATAGPASRRRGVKSNVFAVLATLVWGSVPAALGAPAFQAVEADVCVYGGTSGGVIAAVQAARLGKRVMIVEPGQHLGGMTAGGLSAVDIGDPRAVGGIAREYFTRLAGSCGKTLAWDRPFARKGGGPATGGAYSIEPHEAERVFNDMAREARADVYFGARLVSVKKDGARIVELVAEDGRMFRAKMFLDTTYEGDLMAKGGVSYTLQREGNAQYGETYNGIHYSSLSNLANGILARQCGMQDRRLYDGPAKSECADFAGSRQHSQCAPKERALGFSSPQGLLAAS
jgi:hypothetical protein